MNEQKRWMPLLRLWVIAIVVLSIAGGTAGRVRAQDGDESGGACGDPATLIHAIQGSGERTPIGGDEVTIEAVVIGDYQGGDELQGFFLQEEDADADSDPETSEGIFVDGRLIQDDVQVGDVVRVTGTAFDVSDSGQWRTQLNRANMDAFTICDSGVAVTPTLIELPLADAALWEQFEGMLVEVNDTLTVTQLYNLGRYGEVQVAAGGRLYQPTNMARPGPEAEAIAAQNAQRSFFMDDANSLQNLDPTYYPDGGLSVSNILRSGFTTDGVVGVFDHRFGTYRLYAYEPPAFEPANPRPVAPVTPGRLEIVAFNVFNYFNGDGTGGGFPTERGADTASEFARQQEKIATALAELDSSVIGLMEIENDGDGPESAIADLTNALNVQVGEQVYDYIRDPDGLPLPDEGGDAIKQAIIYNTFAVQPVGDAVTTLDPPFDNRRPPVVQAFEEIETGQQFILAVNHFKSKNCPGRGENADQGDGQSCWNAERVQAAETLSTWLETDPTGTGEPDMLLIGDFNAYTQEDPLVAFAEAGYVNLVPLMQGEQHYSYVFYGMAGALDHALASESLLPQVVDALIWHINADEPRVFDYNVEYKSDSQVGAWYEANPYRSSDHDPVLIGLDLGGDAPAAFDATPFPTATQAVTVSPAVDATGTATDAPEATSTPTSEPTAEPTVAPTDTAEPTVTPTEEPTAEPTAEPTEEPTVEPTLEPTVTPTEAVEDTPEAPPGEDTQAGEGESISDSTGGIIAIIGGAVAVLLAIGAAFIGRRT